MTYNIEVLHNQLKNAGLPIAGVDSDGKVSWGSEPTAKQAQDAKELIEAHDPSLVLSLSINFLDELSEKFFEQETELVNWGKESFFIQSVMTDKSFTATKKSIAKLKARVEKSKEDSSSALSAGLADALLIELDNIGGRLA